MLRCIICRLNDAYEGALPQREFMGDNMYSLHELNAEGQKQKRGYWVERRQRGKHQYQEAWRKKRREFSD
jgi:hypothetical protein